MISLGLGCAVASASGDHMWWAFAHHRHSEKRIVNPVTQPWREYLLHVEVIGDAAPTREGDAAVLTRVVTPYLGEVRSGTVEVVLRDIPEATRRRLSPGDRLIVAGYARLDDGRWLLVPVEPEIDLQQLHVLEVPGTQAWPPRRHEQTAICPLLHPPPDACPTTPDRVMRGWTWFGQLHEQYRGQVLFDQKLRRRHTMQGSPPVPGWPPIALPLPDLIFEHPYDEALCLVDQAAVIDLETLECDLDRDELCIGRGRVGHAFSDVIPPPGHPIEVVLPPELCPFVPGAHQELVFLDETDGPAPWTVVDMAIWGSRFIGAASRDPIRKGGISSRASFDVRDVLDVEPTCAESR